MNLYIETENGQPKNHPAFENNLIEAFGYVPTNWEAFVRVEKPELGIYQLFNDPEFTYQKINGVWSDAWSIREMTAEEKSEKQQLAQNKFFNREYSTNWSAWTLDEATCTMKPPIPRPEYVEGQDIRWCGADNNWKEVPSKPVDDNQYKFNFLAWEWEQVVN